jgi:hypothetical protein
MVLIDTFVFKCESDSDIIIIIIIIKTDLSTPPAGGRVDIVGYMVNTWHRSHFLNV